MLLSELQTHCVAPHQLASQPTLGRLPYLSRMVPGTFPAVSQSPYLPIPPSCLHLLQEVGLGFSTPLQPPTGLGILVAVVLRSYLNGCLEAPTSPAAVQQEPVTKVDVWESYSPKRQIRPVRDGSQDEPIVCLLLR